jgi:predicted enzyme related to lactoylglutathione lyase
MSDAVKIEIGSINWADLTVPNADEVRDFYSAVVGWTPVALDMGGYSDYCMNLPESNRTVAGVCHARGVNANLPAQWLVYINVADLDKSIQACTEKGGKVLAGPRSMGPQGRYCVIQDPAGAAAALFEPGRAEA